MSAQMKVCKTCKEEKPINEFRHRKNLKCRSGISVEPYCKPCERAQQKIRCKKRYQEKGKKEFAEMYADPQKRTEWLAKNKDWRDKNKQYLEEYRDNRRDQDRKILREWRRNKLKNSPVHRLRSLVSSSVGSAIKRVGSRKKGSIVKHLPYTITQLKQHLEAQFEPWMTWENHGMYNKGAWDDNDPSTWTWQVDHIIPHSDLPYDSMEHPNFLKCWELTNLRPMKAKDNVEEGTRRVRHKGA